MKLKNLPIAVSELDNFPRIPSFGSLGSPVKASFILVPMPVNSPPVELPSASFAPNNISLNLGQNFVLIHSEAYPNKDTPPAIPTTLRPVFANEPNGPPKNPNTDEIAEPILLNNPSPSSFLSLLPFFLPAPKAVAILSSIPT